VIDKVTETASEVEQTTKEITRELKETTFGAAEAISLALGVAFIVAVVGSLLLVIAII
jgi:hypothetical protein